MLGSDVPLGALGRFEGHRAIGALMKHLTVSCLNVGLDGVQTSEHNLTAGAPGIKESKFEQVQVGNFFDLKQSCKARKLPAISQNTERN